MARIARVIVPGYPHHITQRGNRRQKTFFCKKDYELYKGLMAQWSRRKRGHLFFILRSTMRNKSIRFFPGPLLYPD
jgi:REP element-mobilizing transposase RayT